MIAVRELSLEGLDAQQRNWTNDTTVYTHGYGVVAAYGNTTAGRGAPAFWEQGIPSQGQMGEYEPRIYFSPKAPLYSIVGAPRGRSRGSSTTRPTTRRVPSTAPSRRRTSPPARRSATR